MRVVASRVFTDADEPYTYSLTGINKDSVGVNKVAGVNKIIKRRGRGATFFRRRRVSAGGARPRVSLWRGACYTRHPV